MAERESVGMRLAFRNEGVLWNAYVAEMHTMKGAVLVGSIAMGAVVNPARKEQFMMLMRDVMGDYLAEGGAVVEWGEPVAGPEHERGSRA